MPLYQPPEFRHYLRADEIDQVGNTALAIPNDILAPCHPTLMGSAATAAGSANDMRGVRVRAHRSGILRDLYVFIVTADAVNNYDAGVFDAGATTSGTWTLLFSTGATSAASHTNNTWTKLCSPELSVVAGRDYILAFASLSTTETYARIGQGLVNSAASQLPADFWPTTDNVKNLTTTLTASKYPLATAVQSSFTANTITPYMMARIV